MNKPNKEILDVFGRILYAMAMADGEVQEAEVQALHDVIKKNPWAKQVSLSFDLARHLDMDPWIMFLKNMRIFRTQAVDEHYPYFVELLEKIALAHEGIVPEERAMLEKFRSYFEGTGLHGAPKHYGLHSHAVRI